MRALVRDVPKAEDLLQPASQPLLEIVGGDLTQPRTLAPEAFAGVRAIASCSAVKVAPKEGDTNDRSKYYQGIKFYDPEIVGDTPESVELGGMRNLLEAAKDAPQCALFGDGSAAPGQAREYAVLLGEGAPAGAAARWGALDDVVMGGASESALLRVEGAGEGGARPAYVFGGVLRTENNGGFASVRTRNYEPPLDFGAYDGLALRVRGDGRRYKVQLRTDADWDGVSYCATMVAPPEGEWATVDVPFASFVPTRRANTLLGGPPLDPSSVCSVQLMLSKFELDGELNPTFEAGPFSLPVESVVAYKAGAASAGAAAADALGGAQMVHVSSAGVSRPFRPDEFDFAAEPPAVGLNDELGGILTYKWLGERTIRESGLGYAIVRPGALVEEPAGAELEWGQGDVLKGKVSRDAIADMVVSALESEEAVGKTFEVKCTLPFPEAFVPPEGFVPKRDYGEDFAKLEKDTDREAKDLTITIPGEANVAA